MKFSFKNALLTTLGLFTSLTLSSCELEDILNMFNKESESTVDVEDKIRNIYEKALANGFDGSYEEWLKSIKGEDGKDGQDGKDGVGITSIELIQTIGDTDVYLITLSNGNTKSFTIRNGQDGADGKDGQDGKDGKDGTDGKDGYTPVITISADGYWVIDGVKTTTLAKGEKGETGETGQAGTDGKDGQDGKDGKDGADGKDGTDGEDGHTPVITISTDGYWVIDGVKTATLAKGEKGDQGEKGDSNVTILDPEITIGDNGNWFINGVDTNKKAITDKQVLDNIYLAIRTSEGNCNLALIDYFIEEIDVPATYKGAPVVCLSNAATEIGGAFAVKKINLNSETTKIAYYSYYFPCLEEINYPGTIEQFKSLHGSNVSKFINNKVLINCSNGCIHEHKWIMEFTTIDKLTDKYLATVTCEYCEVTNSEELDSNGIGGFYSYVSQNVFNTLDVDDLDLILLPKKIDTEFQDEQISSSSFDFCWSINDECIYKNNIVIENYNDEYYKLSYINIDSVEIEQIILDLTQGFDEYSYTYTNTIINPKYNALKEFFEHSISNINSSYEYNGSNKDAIMLPKKEDALCDGIQIEYEWGISNNDENKNYLSIQEYNTQYYIVSIDSEYIDSIDSISVVGKFTYGTIVFEKEITFSFYGYDESRFAKTGYTYVEPKGNLNAYWNPINFGTLNINGEVLGYITTPLYDYQLNETRDGYEIVNELAGALPVDVTSNYVGQFGVENGDSKKAWRIALNPDATWENGDKITADDYVYTMQQLLDQNQDNYRAFSVYEGSLSIVNAKNYLYSGNISYNNIWSIGYYSIEDARAAGLNLFVDAWGFLGTQGYTDANGNECPQYVPINDTVAYNNADLSDEFVAADVVADYLADGAAYAAYAGSYIYYSVDTPVTTWDQVGFLKIDNYTIDIILENAMEEPTAFYLPYYLSSIYLIHEETYEASWDEYHSSNLYGRDAEHTMSYGPYKLDYFGYQAHFSRNGEWYGYKAGATNGAVTHDGQYQTTDIVWETIDTHSSAMLAFESGQIDIINLGSEDLISYGSSDYIIYTPQSYTTKLTFNTDFASLEAMEIENGDGKNRTIQTVKEFREAFSFCIDRTYFATQFTAAASAGYGLLNYMYQYFNADGSTSAYRDSVDAKKTLLHVYGVEYGVGKEYETIDEAYEAMTGYNMDKARALMAEAYTKAVDAGVYTAGEDVVIQINGYASDAIYVNMVNYFDTQIKSACIGTPLEGHVSFTLYDDNNYYYTMWGGRAQLIFSTWGGDSYDTFGILQYCYCDDHTGNGNQMEYGFDTSKVDVTVNLKGQDYTYSLQAWAYWANLDYTKGGENIQEVLGSFNDLSAEEKCKVLAACEEAHLSYFVAIPIYYRQSASLHSKKINYGTNTYVDLIGFGGIRHITFNYTDAEWAAFIADANNLVY